MANGGDTVKIVLSATFAGNKGQNVYWYNLGDTGQGSMSLQDVVTGWFTNYNTQIVPFISGALVYDNIYIENASNDLEFYEDIISTGGQVGGNALPAQATLTFKLVRSTKVTRNGSKRLMGVPESFQTAGLLTYPQASVDQMQDFFAEVLQFPDASNAGNDIIMSPVIIGRTLNANGVYEIDLNKFNPISNSVLNPYVGSQDTRRP